jgi:hypothetical protein
MLAAGTVPAQAAAMHGRELQAALHGGHVYPGAGGRAAAHLARWAYRG